MSPVMAQGYVIPNFAGSYSFVVKYVKQALTRSRIILVTCIVLPLDRAKNCFSAFTTKRLPRRSSTYHQGLSVSARQNYRDREYINLTTKLSFSRLYNLQPEINYKQSCGADCKRYYTHLLTSCNLSWLRGLFIKVFTYGLLAAFSLSSGCNEDESMMMAQALFTWSGNFS